MGAIHRYAAGRAAAAVLLLIGLFTSLAGCGGSGGPAPSLTSISIGPPAATIANGLTQQLSATGIYSDGSKSPVTAVTWGSSNPSVATITVGTGLASARGVGSTTITASVNGVSGTATLTVSAATLVSIGVTPAKSRLAVGVRQQLKAIGVYTDNSIRDVTRSVTWTSSNPRVVSTSTAAATDGVATAAAVGTTTVTAAMGGVFASTELTVTPAVLASIEITPASLSVAAGLQHQFMATGIFTDGSKHDLTTSATWVSSAPKVASVSNSMGSSGLMTTVTAGPCTITASSAGVTGTASLTVTAAALVSITVTPANPKVVATLTLPLHATGIYTDQSSHDVTAQAVWSSSNVQVATISNAIGFSGQVMALMPGPVTVTATVGPISAATGLTVVAATVVAISINPPSSTIAGGTDQQFTATGLFTDNSTEDLTTSATWTSSVPAVAAVSNAPGSNGLTSALSAGASTITAAFGGVTGSAKLTVSTPQLISIAVTPANLSIALGSTQQYQATGTFSDGSTQDLTAAVTWSATSPTVLSISNALGFSGNATPLLVGSTQVSAALGPIAGTTSLTVNPATLTSIAVTPAAASVPLGLDQQFSATGTYSDGSTQDLTAAVTWSSSAAAASISNVSGEQGRASGVNVGATQLVANLASLSGSASLTVTSATLVSLSVIPGAVTLASGGYRQFTATGTYTDNSIRNLTTAVTWISADSSIAAISTAAGSRGLASGIGTGSTSITAALSTITSAPSTITIASAPEFAYAVNTYDGTVSQYTVGAGGVLSPMSAPTVTVGNSPESVVVDPSGSYAYVANSGDGTISEFSLGTMGALTALTASPVPAGNTPQSVVVDPSGRYVYAANTGDGTVSQYAIGAGGALSALSPSTTAAGTGPDAVAVDPTGHYVYVANYYDGTVSQFSIGVGGALTALNPSTVLAGSQPQAITVDPTGRYVYIVNCGDYSVSQFAIGPGGALTALNPASVATGTFPQSIAIDAGGHTAYVANNIDGTVSEYSIGRGGTLTALGPAVTVGNGPQAVTVDITGQYVYVANEQDGTIAALVIGSGGALAATTSVVGTGSGPYAITTAF